MSEELELDDLALDVPCGYCGADSGVWCHTKSSRRATWLHGARTDPVYSAYGLGYTDAERHYRAKAQA